MDAPVLRFADIESAARRLAGQVQDTPCLASRTLSQITGAEVFLKFENLQFTASFKERGALNRLALLGADECRRGVVAVSAGNHAQGVAWHASRLGIPATIVMPRFTPSVKVERTREFGAEVVLHGERFDQARAHGLALAAERGLTMIDPFDDDAVMAGQGTIGVEMLAARPDLDDLVVPIGGGGLIAGIATAAKHLKPGIRVTGVQVERFALVHDAIEGGQHPLGASSIAEGIAVDRLGERTLPVIRQRVDRVLLVDEGDVEQAVLMLLEIEKTVAEGAGAVPLAALLRHPEHFRGRRVGLVLSGATSIRCCSPRSSSAAWSARAGWPGSTSTFATFRARLRKSPRCWPTNRPTSRRSGTSARSAASARSASRSRSSSRRVVRRTCRHFSPGWPARGSRPARAESAAPLRAAIVAALAARLDPGRRSPWIP